jgi:hypothetical protein
MHCNITLPPTPLQFLVLNHPEPTFIIVEWKLLGLKNVNEGATFKDDLLIKNIFFTDTDR